VNCYAGPPIGALGPQRVPHFHGRAVSTLRAENRREENRMAGKSPKKGRSRLDQRRMVEAAEKNSTTKKKTAPKKKKVTKAKSRSKKAKDTVQRKRVVWGVFSGSMKEEARFPYDKQKDAEAKLEQLRSKSKKPYFIQPIKEVITDAPDSDD
jgi:hypothetical protein